MEDQLEKIETLLEQTKDHQKQDKREADAKHAQDLVDLTAKYEAKGEKAREEFEAKRVQDKADTDEKINELRNLFESQQQASSSDTQTQESNAGCRLFKP